MRSAAVWKLANFLAAYGQPSEKYEEIYTTQISVKHANLNHFFGLLNIQKG